MCYVSGRARVCVYQNLAKKKVGRKVDHTMRIKKLTCPSMPLSREPINFVFEYTEFYSSCVVYSSRFTSNS